MTLFVFDYSETLDRLPDPVAFVAEVRVRHPGCRIVLFTGTMRYTIDARHPGLWSACDQVLVKPAMLDDVLDEKTTHVVYVDDEPSLRSMAQRMARRTPTVNWTILGPEALAGLVTG